MSEEKIYLQYAEDCLRIAEKMQGKDRQTLLKIAEAWRTRAEGTVRAAKPNKSLDPDSGDASPVQ